MLRRPGVVLWLAGLAASGCSVGSLVGGEIPCASDAACPPERALCLDARCVEAPAGEGEGEGEGEAGEGEGEGEAGEGEGEGEGEAGPRCGDGVINTPAEACDDGDNDDGDACTNACTVAICGDGIVHVGVEACDDGDAGSDTCTPGCLQIVCGDGRVDGDEACDDGVLGELDGCTDDCQIDRCGDNQLDAGETCDDGNRLSLDGCSARCDAIAWQTSVGSGIGAGPVLLPANGVAFVVVGTSDGEVVGLAATSGLPFRVPVGEPVVSVVVTTGRVVAATASGDVVGIGFDAGTPVVEWRRDDIAVGGGRARLASVDTRVFVVTPAGGVRALDDAGQNAQVIGANNAAYPHLGAAPAPLAAADCDPCFPLLVSAVDDDTPPGAVIVPMGNGVAVWNVENGCPPARVAFGNDPSETARTRAVADRNQTFLVSSRGALLRLDASGTCTDPVDAVRRVEGGFVTEPISVAVGNAVAWVVADGTRLRALQVVGTAPVTELGGFPAALPPGRAVRVPVARDATGAFVVVDDVGDVHVYSAAAARRLLGGVGAAPAAGPLLVSTGQGRPALAVVATVDGRVVAVEGAGAPATSGWRREGGDQRGTAHATCAGGAGGSLLALLAVLPVWRSRRRHHP